MVQPAHQITEPPVPPRPRVRTVAPASLAAAHLRLFPAEARSLDQEAFATAWLQKYEANPEACIGTAAEQRQFTQVLFEALGLPMPNTTEMALFLATNPDLEEQPTELVFISAKTSDENNLDLIVRAVSREHAEIVWRDHFDGWDMPQRPYTITTIPVAGLPGAIPWDVIAPHVEEPVDQDSEDEFPAPR
jgi:hypothetical protein